LGALASARRKVLIATLWQRTSGKGNEYLSGFLGKAASLASRVSRLLTASPHGTSPSSPGRSRTSAPAAGSPTPPANFIEPDGRPALSDPKGLHLHSFERYDVDAKGRRAKGQHEMLEGLV
jgi:hypothetical protein